MNGKPLRTAFDTGVLVSAILRPNSPPAEAVGQAFSRGPVVTSTAASRELLDVIQRPKFDRYIPRSTRSVQAEELLSLMLRVDVRSVVKLCADPKDNALLELALDAQADFLVSSDDHLLRLHPFRGIPILSPRDFILANGQTF